jgi:hypothetical protein
MRDKGRTVERLPAATPAPISSRLPNSALAIWRNQFKSLSLDIAISLKVSS